ncbi:MAG: DUF1648 domain-containing protein [Actinomycetes bacterium]|jgi:hypothetical protein
MRNDRSIVLMAVLLGIVAPLVIAGAGMGLVYSWWDELPDVIATHWTNDRPDGFSSKSTVPWLLFGVAGVLPVLIGSGVIYVLRTGRRDPAYRFQTALMPGLSAFLTILIVGSIHAQRGLADAAGAGPIGRWVGAGFLAMAVVTLLGWVVQPKQERGYVGEEAEPLPLEPGETAVWTGEVRAAPLVIWVGAIGIIISAAASTRILVDGMFVPGLAVAGTALVLGLVTFGYSRARVIVDGRGLTVRPVMGWPVYRVPLEDVARVESGDVSAIAQFGGFGFRWIPGAFGIILRAGDAISVIRRDGRRFVVTVSDAATGAALLRTYMERR